MIINEVQALFSNSEISLLVELQTRTILCKMNTQWSHNEAQAE